MGNDFWEALTISTPMLLCSCSHSYFHPYSNPIPISVGIPFSCTLRRCAIRLTNPRTLLFFLLRTFSLCVIIVNNYVCQFSLTKEPIWLDLTWLVTVTVFGCADLLPDDKNAVVTRLGDTAVIRCIDPDQVFVLTCTNGRWIGTQTSNCSSTGSMIPCSWMYLTTSFDRHNT